MAKKTRIADDDRTAVTPDPDEEEELDPTAVLVGIKMGQALVETATSAAEMARHLGIDSSTVSRWLKGQKMPKRLEMMQRFAAKVGKPLCWFYDVEGWFDGKEQEERLAEEIREGIMEVFRAHFLYGLSLPEAAEKVVRGYRGKLSPGERRRLEEWAEVWERLPAVVEARPNGRKSSPDAVPEEAEPADAARPRDRGRGRALVGRDV